MILPLLAFSAAVASSARAASSCAIFDANFDLYVFGGSNDVKLGSASNFASPSATTLTSSGRPPYTGSALTCHLSQAFNAVYLLGASSSAPSDMYIYSFGSSSWSTQSTSNAPDFSKTSTGTVLDHDTNTFFTLAGGTALSQLDVSASNGVASGSSVAWEGVNTAPFDSTTYNPTMALASNHIMYIGAPSVEAGSAEIFVVHYATWQAQAQAFPTLNNGAAFPSSHGQATSFFLASGEAQLQFAYVPDDFSSTYIVTHWTSPSTAGSTDGAPSGISNFINSTQVLPAPSSKDTASTYAASDTSLVQLTSTGELYYLPVFASSSEVGGYAVQSDAAWAKIGYTLAGASGGNSSSAGGSSASASGTAMASGSAAAASASGAAVSKTASAASRAASASSTAAATGAGERSFEAGFVGRVLAAGAVGLGAVFLF